MTNTNNFSSYTASSITFLSGATGAFTLSGSAITLSGNITNSSTNTQTINLNMVTTGVRTITTGSSGAIVIGGAISGASGGITKTGLGTLTLTGSNSYTGATTINQGTLLLDFSAAGAPATNIINNTSNSSALTIGAVNDVNTLNIKFSNSGTANTQRFNGLTLAGSTKSIIQITQNGNSNSASGVTLGGITRNAASTVDFILPTTGSISTSSTAFACNSILVSASTNGIAFATSSGTSWITNTSGTLGALGSYSTGTSNYLAANNVDVTDLDSVSGVTVNTLRFNGNNALTLAGTNTVSTGGVLVTSAAGTGASIAGGTLISGGGKEMVLINNGVLNIGSVIADSTSGTSALTVSGAGVTTLSGTNTYTGNTAVLSGTLKAGSTQAFGVGSAVSLANIAGTLLDINGNNNTIGSLSGGGANGGAVALGSGTLTLNLPANSTYGGVFSGAGTLVLNGTATNTTFTLSGAAVSTAFTGIVDVKKGILSFGSVHNILGTVTDGAAVLVENGAEALRDYANNGNYNALQTFIINGTGADGNGALQWLGSNFGATGMGTLVVASDASAKFTGNQANTITALSGTGNLTLSGTTTGNITITGSARPMTVGGVTYAAFNGNVNLRTGMKLGSNNATALGTGNLDLADGTTFTLGATQTIGGLTDTTSTLHTGTVTLGANTLTVGNTTTNLSGTFGGVIAGTGGVTKAGAGTLTLAGSNTYTGITTINGGVLSANTIADATSSSIGLSAAANALTFGASNGTLNFTGVTGTTKRAITFTGAGTFDIASGSTLTVGGTGAGAATTTNGLWTGNGGIVKSGSGTLTVRNNGARTGGFVVNSVTGGAFTMQSGTLNISPEGTGGGAHAVIGDSAGNPGLFNQTGGTVNYAPLNASTVQYFFVGITSSGTLNVTGGTFTADSVKTGGIQVARGVAGTLSIGGGAGAALVDTPMVNFGQSSAGTGTLNLYTNGTLLTGTVSVANGTNTANFDGGTLKAKSSNASFMSGLTTAAITANGLTVDTNNFNVTVAQVLSGTGGLTKTSAGTLALSGSNTYTGPTLISSGTLQIGGSGTTGRLSTSSSITDNATLAFRRSDTITQGTDFASGIGGSGGISLVSNSSAGVVVLNGSNSFTGNIGITSGVLKITTATALGNGTKTVTMTGGSGEAANLGFQLDGSGGNIVLPSTVSFVASSNSLAGIRSLSGTNQIQGNITLTTGLSALGIGSDAGKLTVSGNIDANAASRFLNLNGASTNANTISGNISDGTGSLAVTKNDAGVWVLSGSNSYTGVTTINASGNTSALLVAANNALGTTAGNTVVSSTAALGFSGGINYSTAEQIVGSGVGNTAASGTFSSVQRGFVQSVSGSNTFAGNIQVNADGSRIGTQNGAQLTLTGTITQGVAGVGVLFRAGDNNGDFVTLSGSGNFWDKDTTIFSGATTGNAGVRLGITNGLPTGVSVGATSSAGAGNSLDLAGYDQTLNGLVSLGGSLKIYNSATSGTSTLTLNTTADRTNTNTTIIDGTNGGKIALVKQGSFTQFLNTLNTYTGDTSINGGTLSINTVASGTNAQSMGGGTQVNMSGDGTLRYSGTAANTLDKNITVTSGTGSVVSAGSGLLTLSGNMVKDGTTLVLSGSSGGITVSGVISGASANSDLVVTSGLVNLTNANTYVGATTVSGGTLQLSSTGSINNSSAIGINGSGAKFLQTSSVTVTPTVTLTNGTVDGTGSIDNLIVTDSIMNIVTAGNGGSGVLTLGNLTFNGAASVNLTSAGNAMLTYLATTGTLTSSGTATVNIAGSFDTWTSGTYNLISYGSLVGGSNNFALGTLSGSNSRTQASLIDSGSAIALAISSDYLIWTGSDSNGLWKTGTTGSNANWKLATSGTTDFQTGDTVVFDNDGTTTAIEISDANVSPTATTFNNNTQDYILSSSNGYGIASGRLIKSGTGTLTINNSNSYTGATAVNNGTLILNGTLGSTAIGVASGATFNESATGVISGSASLNSSGSTTLAGANTYTGTTQISNGTLAASSIIVTGGTSNLGNATSAVILGDASNKGTLSYIGTSGTYTRGFTVNAGGGELDVASGQTLTLTTGTVNTTPGGVFTVGGDGNTFISSVIGAGSGGLSKTGTGTLTLNGANTFTGAVTINQGTVIAQNNAAFGTSAGGVTVANGATIDLGGTLAAGALNLGAEIITISGTGVGGNGALVNNSANTQINAVQKAVLAADASIGGATRWDMRGTGNTLNLGGFTLTKTGTNYIPLVSTSVTPGSTGAITVAAGTLSLTNASGSNNILNGSSSNILTVNNGGTLELYNGGTWVAPVWTLTLSGSSNLATANGSSSWAGPVSLSGTANAAITQNFAITGDISGGGALVKTGANTFTFTLSGSNSYGGGTTMNGGIIVANNNNALGTGALNINAGSSRLVVNDGFTIANNINITGGGVSFRGLIENSGTGNAILTGGTITISGALAAGGHFASATGGTLTVGDVINSASNAVTSRIGTVIFSGGGSYSKFTMNEGTVRLGATNGLSTSATFDLAASSTGTFDLAGYDQSLAGITRISSQSATITNSGTTNSLLTLTGSSTYPGLITNGTNGGTVALAITGGTHTLSGNNTYTGLTDVQGGTLSLGRNGGTIANTAPVQVSGGTLDVAQSDSVGSVTLASGIISGTATLTGTSYVVQSGTASANLAGSGVVLTKSTAGTVSLSGSNTYTGATTITAGTLAITGTHALGGTSGVNIADTATLGYTGGASTLAKNITVTSGTGTISNSGTGLLTLSGTLTEDATTLTLNGGSQGITVSGRIVGASPNSDLVITTGTTTLTSTNSYNGATYVNTSATLVNGITNALPVGTTLVLGGTDNSVGTYDLAGYNQTIASLTSQGSGGVSNVITNSSGATDSELKMSNGGTFAGRIQDGPSRKTNLTVDGGTLTLSPGADLALTGTIAINNGGTLLLGGSNEINNAASVNLAGGTFKTGGNDEVVGALTLSASSTIDFNNNGTLRFTSDSTSTSGLLLTINNWTGGFGGGIGNHLVFTNAPTSTLLGEIQFTGFGQGANAIVFSDGNGNGFELAPIPEPATIIGAFAFLGLIVLRERRRIVSLWKTHTTNV